MRPFCVVDLEPVLGDQSHLRQRLADVGVQHLFPIRPVESLDKGVLLRLARLDELQRDVVGCAPVHERLGPEFTAVVEPNRSREATELVQLFHDSNAPARR